MAKIAKPSSVLCQLGLERGSIMAVRGRVALLGVGTPLANLSVDRPIV